MATSTIQTNNKLIKFTQEINREWVRENMFSPYMGEDVNSIIRRRMELKSGGEADEYPAGHAAHRRRRFDRHPGRQRRSDRRLRLPHLARMGTQRRRHHQGRTAEGQRRHLRRGQAAALRLDQGTNPRRDHRRADGAAVGNPAGGRRSRQRHPVRTSPPPPRRASGSRTTPTACCSVPRLPTGCVSGGHRPRGVAGQRRHHRGQIHGGQPVAAQAGRDGRQSAHSALHAPRTATSITSRSPASTRSAISRSICRP